MAIQVFGRGMNHEISTIVQRPRENRSGDRAVDTKYGIVGMGNFCRSFNISYMQIWVIGCLYPDNAGVAMPPALRSSIVETLHGSYSDIKISARSQCFCNQLFTPQYIASGTTI